MALILTTLARIIITMTDPQLLLQIWFSPSFPVGSFAYSHSLEWAVEAGDLKTKEDLSNWMFALLQHGGVSNECILLKCAWEHTLAGRFSGLAELNDLALALSPSRERYLETTAQGNAFLNAILGAWPRPEILHFSDELAGDVAYPVAAGVAAASHGISLKPLLNAYAFAFCAMLVSSAVRLSLIGQVDAQKILAACCPRIETLAQRTSASTLNDLGSCALHADLCSLYHETQYSRLFRS